jgi:hypothetical protein
LHPPGIPYRCREKDILRIPLTEPEKGLIIGVIDGVLTELDLNPRTVLLQLVADVKQGQTGMGKPGIEGDNLYLHGRFILKVAGCSITAQSPEGIDGYPGAWDKKQPGTHRGKNGM